MATARTNIASPKETSNTASTAGQRRGGRGASRAAGAGDKNRVAAIREWARKTGHQVSERGRIAATVLAAYEAAH